MLCELLEVDLEDRRVARARDCTLEMVADSEASETAGLSWALTVRIVEGPSSYPILTIRLRLS